jgi:hypothetical protein
LNCSISPAWLFGTLAKVPKKVSLFNFVFSLLLSSSNAIKIKYLRTYKVSKLPSKLGIHQLHVYKLIGKGGAVGLDVKLLEEAQEYS